MSQSFFAEKSAERGICTADKTAAGSFYFIVYNLDFIYINVCISFVILSLNETDLYRKGKYYINRLWEGKTFFALFYL